MHEGEKLEEAKYFYSKMIEEKEDRDNFRYNLSAFLSAARSVLQYALEEARPKRGGLQWYNDCVSTSTISQFFRDKRDISIHTDPIRPRVDYDLTIKDTLHLSESLSIVVRDKYGNIKHQYSSGEAKRKPKPKQPGTPATLKIKHKFDDWSGSQDILTLCQMYIQELEDIIKDGIRQGFITG